MKCQNKKYLAKQNREENLINSIFIFTNILIAGWSSVLLKLIAISIFISYDLRLLLSTFSNYPGPRALTF